VDIHREEQKGPPDDPAIDKALNDIRKAEDDLTHAREEECRAEHELEEAIEELEHGQIYQRAGAHRDPARIELTRDRLEQRLVQGDRALTPDRWAASNRPEHRRKVAM